MSNRDRRYGKSLYRESIRWSFPVWAFVIFIDLSVALAIWAALSMSATWITLIILTALTLFAYFKSTLKIEVTQGWFLVGPAAIERAFIHNFKNLNGEQMKSSRGRNAHPLNFLQIRFWVPGGISLAIRDPRDKTPNWIISSKRSEELIRALENAQH